MMCAGKITRMCATDGIELVAECDVTDPPEITDEHIRFNGFGNAGHETFILEPTMESFAFCKTAQKPYDVAVVAILHCASVIAGVEFTSDGDEKDLADGVYMGSMVMETLGIMPAVKHG